MKDLINYLENCTLVECEEAGSDVILRFQVPADPNEPGNPMPEIRTVTVAGTTFADFRF